MVIDSPYSAPPRKAAVAFIFVTVLLDVLALGVVIPVLAPLVKGMLDGNTAKASVIYGVFGTVFAFMQFVCSPTIGALSDRFGRRPIILLSNFGLGFDYILMALAPNVTILFVGRVISGITSASIPTAYAYISDVTAPEKRAGAFGMMGAAFGLGFVLGPAVGGVLGNVDPRLPFWVAACLSLANAMFGLFILPESLPTQRRMPFAWARANPFGSMALLLSHPELIGLATVSFLNNLAHESLPSTYVLYAGYRYGWTGQTVGLTLAAIGVCSMVVQGGLVRPVVARFGERLPLLVGLFFGGAAFFIYGAASTGVFFLVGVPVMALWGFYGPSAQGLMSRRVSPSEQGQLQGSLNSLRGVTGMLGPGLFTQTFAAAIDPNQYWHVPGAPFLLASALVMLALPFAWWVTRPQPDSLSLQSDPSPSRQP